MAERRETSVMSSIHEILKDAEGREEQEKLDAARLAREAEQRRVDEARRKKDEEEARIRAEQDDRERRTFEEQRRQAELQAVQETALQRARMETESKARLAEMNARQEHERHLHAMTHDKSKKRLTMLLWSLGIIALVAAGAGGVFIKKAMDETARAKEHAAELQQQVDQAEQKRQRISNELENAKDPEKIQELQRQLEEQQQKLHDLGRPAPPPRPRAAPGPGGPPKPRNGGGGGGGKPCDCTPGDPLCSCL